VGPWCVMGQVGVHCTPGQPGRRLQGQPSASLGASSRPCVPRCLRVIPCVLSASGWAGSPLPRCVTTSPRWLRAGKTVTTTCKASAMHVTRARPLQRRCAAATVGQGRGASNLWSPITGNRPSSQIFSRGSIGEGGYPLPCIR